MADDKWLSTYFETSQKILCGSMRDYWKRTDGKVPTRVWVDGDRVLICFDTPVAPEES